MKIARELTLDGCAGLQAYEEVRPYYEQLHLRAGVLIQTLVSAGYGLEALLGGATQQHFVETLTSQSAGALASAVSAELAAALPVVAAQQSALAASAATASAVETCLHGSVSAVLAAALVEVMAS
jgi:hypothetical protein